MHDRFKYGFHYDYERKVSSVIHVVSMKLSLIVIDVSLLTVSIKQALPDNRVMNAHVQCADAELKRETNDFVQLFGLVSLHMRCMW